MGALIGFMLTMGGWIMYWVIEYQYIQAKITKLCEKEAGITVYVTPEQWRKQIGEEEWKTLKEDVKVISSDLNFQFNGKNYHEFTQLNKRVVSFKINDNDKEGFFDNDQLIVDKNTNQILFRERYFAVGTPAIANSLEGLKFWYDMINDCDINNWSYDDRFFSNKYSNVNLTQRK